MFIRMLKLPDEVRDRYDLSSLQVAVHAAAPCPVRGQAADDRVVGPDPARVLRRHRGQRLRLHQLRGLAGPPRHGRPQPDSARSTSSTTTASELPAGEAGHHLVRRRRPSSSTTTTRTRRPSRATRNGWSTLGDVGRLDDEGFLYLTDRKAYMIISGGVNIYPQEAENLLVDAPEGGRRGRHRGAQRGLRRGGQGGGAAGRRASTPAPELERELIAYCRAAPGRRQVPAHASTSSTSCPATRPASSTSACCATGTGPATTQHHLSASTWPSSRSWTRPSPSPSPIAAVPATGPRTRCRPSRAPWPSATATSRPTCTSPPTACCAPSTTSASTGSPTAPG